MSSSRRIISLSNSKFDNQLNNSEYLIDGVLKIWEGNLNPVLSPVFIKEGEKYGTKEHWQHTASHIKGIIGQHWMQR
jgi:hypothetical protein